MPKTVLATELPRLEYKNYEGLKKKDWKNAKDDSDCKCVGQGKVSVYKQRDLEPKQLHFPIWSAFIIITIQAKMSL